MQPINFTPAPDPMARFVPLSFSLRVPFMGLPTVIRSNCEAVMAHVERVFGAWRRLDQGLIQDDAQLTVVLIVHPANVGDFGGGPVLYRLHADCLLGSRSADMLAVEPDRGTAVAFLAPETVGQDEEVVPHMLRSIALNLALGHDRSPVSAAAVEGREAALLLVGPTEAGQSALCCACVHQGLRFISEAAVYVSLRGGLRLWHCLPDIHVPAALATHCPELRDSRQSDLRNGQPVRRLETSRWGDDRTALTAGRPIVCLVERQGAATSRLDRTDGESVVAAFARDPQPGFDLSRRPAEVAAALAQCEKYRLHLGSDLDQAAVLLRDLAGGPWRREPGPLRTGHPGREVMPKMG